MTVAWMVLMVVGGLLSLAASVWLLAFAAFGAVAAGYQIRLEERCMATTFGEEYERYKRRVRRWL